MRIVSTILFAIAFAVSAAPTAFALTVPFTEEFAAGTSLWKNNGNGDLTFVPGGGPDGSSYVTTDFAFTSAIIEQVALFRGQSNFNSSGGALVGNWLAESVHRLTAYVRHDAPEPLDFFVRLAAPAGSPAVSFVLPHQVDPGAWTLLDFDVSFANPLHTNEGPPTLAFYEGVLSNIGRVQIGMIVPATQAMNSTPVHYDLDQVSIVPEPSCVLLALGAIASGLIRRKGRSG